MKPGGNVVNVSSIHAVETEGKPEDAAATIAYLASDDTAFVQGAGGRRPAR